jgi:DtxR family Mn-dependent transcriptional regulator
MTSTIENYLKAIYHLSEKGQGAASTSAIAKEMNTSAASVTDMMRKLAEKQLIDYQKYHGAKLTEEGNKKATSLIRNHRLWEYFLVEKLRFGWDEVHDIAEELEHVNSEKLINRLDQFLGFPKFDPHGDPIPSKDGKITIRRQVPLDSLRKGEMGEVVRVQEHSKPFLEYLNDFKIKIGSKIKVLGARKYDGSIEASVNQGQPVSISAKAAQNILLRLI